MISSADAFDAVDAAEAVDAVEPVGAIDPVDAADTVDAANPVDAADTVGALLLPHPESGSRMTSAKNVAKSIFRQRYIFLSPPKT